ncbi:MAG: long-chain fatty acid--CoA ligase, partial [Clostridia bacterium]|nr:long-chain fatty acid--CoA ligase [Clostridia bacterium]
SPYIADVVVRGIKDDNGKTVILAEMFLNKDKVKEMGGTPEESKILADIRTVTSELPMYKQIAKIQLRDMEFEKTTTKKIERG